MIWSIFWIAEDLFDNRVCHVFIPSAIHANENLLSCQRLYFCGLVCVILKTSPTQILRSSFSQKWESDQYRPLPLLLLLLSVLLNCCMWASHHWCPLQYLLKKKRACDVFLSYKCVLKVSALDVQAFFCTYFGVSLTRTSVGVFEKDHTDGSNGTTLFKQ